MTKTKSLRNFDFANITDKGLIRAKNEDYIGYFDTINGHIFVLSDGMGGHRGGAVASQKAVESIKLYFTSKYYPNPLEAINDSIEFANHQIISKSKTDEQLFLMGATIVLILIRDDIVYYAHAGDSSLYYFTNNKLIKLTKDHSYVQQLIDDNIIDEHEAWMHPRKNELYNALGSPNLLVDTCISPLVPLSDDYILLCSDGLTNMVENSTIQNILSENSKPYEIAKKLTDLANEEGGEDNISIQLIKFFNLELYDENLDENKIENTNDFNIDYYKTGLTKPLINSIIVTACIILVFVFFNIYMFYNSNKTINNTVKVEVKNKENFKLYKYLVTKKIKIEDIANQFNIKTEYFKKINKIDTLKIGDTLEIPIKAIHLIQQNDEMEILRWMYNTNIHLIMNANKYYNLNLTVGQKIYIPLSNYTDSITIF